MDLRGLNVAPASRTSYVNCLLERSDSDECDVHGFAIRLEIPEEIYLIGFDNIGIARFMLPPLTTVRMAGREIAISAGRTLMASLKNDDLEKATYEVVKTRLVVRQSTSIPNGSLTGLSKRKIRSQNAKTNKCAKYSNIGAFSKGYHVTC